MDLYLDHSYINAVSVNSAFLRYNPEKKTTKTGRLWWKKVKVEEIPGWQIAMDYLSPNGNSYTFTSDGKDYNAMLERFKSLMEQLKTYGSQWADKALEEAIINGGTK
jgi:hypothetical protein